MWMVDNETHECDPEGQKYSNDTHGELKQSSGRECMCSSTSGWMLQLPTDMNEMVVQVRNLTDDFSPLYAFEQD